MGWVVRAEYGRGQLHGSESLLLTCTNMMISAAIHLVNSAMITAVPARNMSTSRVVTHLIHRISEAFCTVRVTKLIYLRLAKMIKECVTGWTGHISAWDLLLGIVYLGIKSETRASVILKYRTYKHTF